MFGFIVVTAHIVRVYNSIQSITDYGGIRFMVKSEENERKYDNESCDIVLQSCFRKQIKFVLLLNFA